MNQLWKKVCTAGMIRNDIGTKELGATLWLQMLGVLNILSGRKEMLEVYEVDAEWVIRGHYRKILSALQKWKVSV